MSLLRAATVADAPAIAAVHVQTWRSSYASILPAAFLAKLDVGARTDGFRVRLGSRDQAHFVAVDEATTRLEGFVSIGRSRDYGPTPTAELYDLYVVDAAQGHGLGQKLFERALGWARAQRLSAVVLWVFEGNVRARRFYERQGGQPAGEKTVAFDGEPYVLCGYEWPDLGSP